MMFAGNELKLQLRHDSFMEQLFLCPVRVELCAFIGFAPEIGMEVAQVLHRRTRQAPDLDKPGRVLAVI